MALLQQPVDKLNRDYITKNPIRSSVGAIAYGTVNMLELGVELTGTLRTGNSLMQRQLRMADKEAIIEEMELDIEIEKRRLALVALSTQPTLATE